MSEISGSVFKQSLFGRPLDIKKVGKCYLGLPLVLRGDAFVLLGIAKYTNSLQLVPRTPKLASKLLPKALR